MWKELKLLDPASSKMVPSMLIKESGCQMSSRLTEKVAKCGKTRVYHTSSMPGNTTRKANIRIQKWNDKCISQQIIFRRLVQWWLTTRWDIIKIGRQGRYRLVWYLWLQKNGKTRSGHARLHARVAMKEDLLRVCELTRVVVNRSRSMNIASFSTRNLQEQCRKSYVAT